MINPSEDLSPDEAQLLAEALRQFNDQLRKLLDKLTNGELLSPEELERLAKMVGLTQMDNLHYREWMVQRLKKALHFKEVQEALQELAEILGKLGMDKQRAEQLTQLMQANQQAPLSGLQQGPGCRSSSAANGRFAILRPSLSSKTHPTT